MPDPIDVPDSAPDGGPAGPAGNGLLTGDGGSPIGPSDLDGAALPGMPPPVDTRVDSAPTKKLGPMGWMSLGWMVVLIGAALLAPILPIKDPSTTHLGVHPQGPMPVADVVTGSADWTHPLGVDDSGRDILARVIFGARSSLMIGFGAIAIGVVIGGALGLLAGYIGGRVDTLLTILFNVLLSIPALVLALALIAVYASSHEDTSPARRTTVIILTLGIISIPTLARITRASTISWSEREFVKAAKVAGARSHRVMIREVLPNVLPAIFSIAVLGVAVVIVLEGSLSILGIGVEGGPSWGNMISEGRDNLRRTPYMVMVPSLVIFFTVFALNYLGDVIRARSDVRESML